MNFKEMSKEDLVDYISTKNAKKKEYIKSYQQTDNGRLKCTTASKKYYHKNRELILEKKRQYYLKKKALKLST